MPHLKKYKDTKLVTPELDIFLTAETGIFSWFNWKRIKFNPRPFSKKEKRSNSEENLVDFHLEIVKKIDALIKEHEGEASSTEELDFISREQPSIPFREIVEIREPFKRKLEMPDFNFKTEVRSKNIFDNLDFGNELFEIKLPGKSLSDFKFVTDLDEPKDIIYIKNTKSESVDGEESHSRMLNNQNKSVQNSARGFPLIRFRGKEERVKLKEKNTKDKAEKTALKSHNKRIEIIATKKKKNGLEKTKKEVEKAKREVEKRKRELEAIERMEKEAKEKEKELKRKEMERQKKEKEEKQLKKLEMEQSYIPVDLNHLSEEIKEKEKEEFEREEIEGQKREKEEEKLKKLELKKAKKLAKEKEKELKEKARLEAKKKRLETEHASKEEKKNIGIFTKKEKPSSSVSEHSFFGKKNIEEQPILDDDIRKILLITDNLLEKLPENVIDEFVQSKDFELYERVISKYKIK